MSVFLKNLDLSKIKSNKRTANSASNRQHGDAFPVKLYEMLEEVERQGNEDIVSWQPDGKLFHVHNVEKFVEEILPAHFKQSKYKSFQRQLNFYGFQRVTSGPMEGSYGHRSFVRGDKELCKGIRRQSNSHSEEAKQKVEMTNSSQEEVDLTTASDDESSSEPVAEMEPAPEKNLPEMEPAPGKNLPELEPLPTKEVEEIVSEMIPKTSCTCTRDSFQEHLDRMFDSFESSHRESYHEDIRMSFVGKSFFFLPVEFTDIYGL